jgi:hypothetical protein
VTNFRVLSPIVGGKSGWCIVDDKAHRQMLTLYESEAEALEEAKRLEASELPHIRAPGFR